MGYREKEDEAEGSTFLRKALGLLAFVIAFIAVKALVGGGFDLVSRKTTDSAKVERLLQSDTRIANFYEPLKQYFPEVYRERVSEIASMIRAGASHDEVAAYSFNASRSFVTSHMSEIASATPGTLARIADAHAAVVEALAQSSPSACAEFGTTGLRPERAKTLSSEVLNELSNAGRLMIEAAHEGSRRPRQRGAELSETDATALLDAVRARGLSDQHTEALFAGKAAEADVLVQCKMTLALYGAVADLEMEQSARAMTVVLQSV